MEQIWKERTKKNQIISNLLDSHFQLVSNHMKNSFETEIKGNWLTTKNCKMKKIKVASELGTTLNNFMKRERENTKRWKNIYQTNK